MKTRIACAASALFLTLAAAGTAAAEPCRLSPYEVIAENERQYFELLGSRGIPDLPEIFSGDVGWSIAEHLATPLEPADGSAHGLLLYLATGAEICVLFWDGMARPDRPPLAVRLEVTPARLTGLIDTTRVLAAGAPATVDRTPKLRHPEAARGPTALAPVAGRAAGLQAALSELAADLFPAELRAGLGRLSHLTVLPALNIGTVPFALLVPDGNGSPLVETTAVTIAPSLAALLTGDVRPWSASTAPLVFGNPDASGDPDWIFPSLPGAEAEARDIAALLGTTAETGIAVTPERVLAAMPAADEIHISAHGYSDPASPLDGSFLALTGGRLTARQIQTQRLNGHPLVVLSACQTGLGGTLDAGIVGLARGFLLAGASLVVASLWNIDDEATAWLMARFVENLRRHAPAEALRLAQLAARQRWPDPAIWSPFIAFGATIVLE